MQVVVKAGHPKLASVKLTKNFASPDCTAKVCLLFFIISVPALGGSVRVEHAWRGSVLYTGRLRIPDFFPDPKIFLSDPRQELGTKDDQFQVLSGFWYEAVRLNIQPQGQTNKA
jgi:hypothetical protein